MSFLPKLLRLVCRNVKKISVKLANCGPFQTYAHVIPFSLKKKEITMNLLIISIVLIISIKQNIQIDHEDQIVLSVTFEEFSG